MMRIKKLDLYIMRKFLGTFFFSLVLILCIVVVFDISEKLEKFLENDAPVKAIVWDYYRNFIPYFANVFSSLFVFISVIFFTSKMAYSSEIIAILSTGISFRRFVMPYVVSAALIAVLSFLLGAFVIPHRVREAVCEQAVCQQGAAYPPADCAGDFYLYVVLFGGVECGV